MKALIAEDNPTTLLMLSKVISEWGHAVVAVADGEQAWAVIQRTESPQLLLLDWAMPGLDGLEVCRRVRGLAESKTMYIILITGRGNKEDLVRGLEAGADEYIAKPFDPMELRARIQVGTRILELQESLAARVRELESAARHVKHLHGLLPICAYCKKIRDDQNYWQQVESYISSKSDAQFSHSVCPKCFEDFVKPSLAEIGVELE